MTIWRNPFDAMVSRYYWERKLKKFKHQNFRDFIHTVATTKMLKNLKIGTINNEFILDKNIQYEKLQDGIEDLGVPGLWDTFKDIRAKSGLRPEGSSTRDMYDAYPETIEIIQKVCALEIEQFGYTLPTHNKP